MLSSDYFFEDVPELTLKITSIIYATAVKNNKEQYIVVDVHNPNAIRKHFENVKR